MNRDFIKSLLKEQKQRFIEKETGTEREILVLCKDLLPLPHAIIIAGMRRTGKSTLLRQIAKKYYSQTAFYYINFDDERWMGFEAKNFNQLFEALIENEGEAKTFLIDEIQIIKGFELFVRRFIDEGYKFIITGSNSDMLSKELGTRLTGRHVELKMHPFSWKEYCTLKSIELPAKKILTTKERIPIYKAFEQYCTYGGMPEYAVYNHEETMRQVYNDLVLKDIAIRFNITNTHVLREFYIYVLTNCTSRYSYSSLQKRLGIQSKSTIINYLDYLELTFFAKQIRKFDFSLQKSIKNDKKLYIIDNGFISLLSQTFTNDKGKLLENCVFNFLAKDSEVFYYSGKGECDFITTQNRKVENLYQVCYELNDNNLTREKNGLLEAMEYCDAHKGFIITNNNEDEITENNKIIKIVPAWKFLF